jgi:hypothetical protein
VISHQFANWLTEVKSFYPSTETGRWTLDFFLNALQRDKPLYYTPKKDIPRLKLPRAGEFSPPKGLRIYNGKFSKANAVRKGKSVAYNRFLPFYSLLISLAL